MSTTTNTDELKNAREQARAQFETIRDLITDLRDATGEERERIERRIRETPLSVRVRSDWHEPGADNGSHEFEILLCTGGPAVRILGGLNEYNEPTDAHMQCQDWFTEWTTVHDAGDESVLVEFARFFWYGER